MDDDVASARIRASLTTLAHSRGLRMIKADCRKSIRLSRGWG
jgi:hypothetical protein